MLLDTYFYKLASQEKGDITKPLASTSSKPYMEPKEDWKYKKYFPSLMFTYDKCDGDKESSFELCQRPSRRISTMIDEYFGNIFEKKANQRFANRFNFTRQTI